MSFSMYNLSTQYAFGLDLHSSFKDEDECGYVIF